jgi:hypothetical protein
LFGYSELTDSIARGKKCKREFFFGGSMYVFSSLENQNPKKKRRISGGYVSKGNRHYGRLPALKWIAQSYGERERVSAKEGVKSNGRVMNSRSVPKEFSFFSLPFVPF